MDIYNTINDNTIKQEPIEGGTLFTEKNMHKQTVNRYLLFPADSTVGNIPLHLKLRGYESIYLPCINYTTEIPNARDDIIDMDARELVVDIKLMTNRLINMPNLVILADASISGLYVDSLMDRKDKVGKVILYCKGKVNWSDIIYDWKDITDNLRIIIGERQMYQSNSLIPFSDIQNIVPPLSMKRQFNLEIEIQQDNEVNQNYLTTGNLNNTDEVGKIENMRWLDVVRGIRGYTPNIYQCDLDSHNIVTNYNTLDDFHPKQPIVIVSKKRIKDYRSRKDKDNSYLELTFNPTVDIVFKSIEKYRRAYLAVH